MNQLRKQKEEAETKLNGQKELMHRLHKELKAGDKTEISAKDMELLWPMLRGRWTREHAMMVEKDAKHVVRTDTEQRESRAQTEAELRDGEGSQQGLARLHNSSANAPLTEDGRTTDSTTVTDTVTAVRDTVAGLFEGAVEAGAQVYQDGFAEEQADEKGDQLKFYYPGAVFLVFVLITVLTGYAVPYLIQTWHGIDDGFDTAITNFELIPQIELALNMSGCLTLLHDKGQYYTPFLTLVDEIETVSSWAGNTASDLNEARSAAKIAYICAAVVSVLYVYWNLHKTLRAFKKVTKELRQDLGSLKRQLKRYGVETDEKKADGDATIVDLQAEVFTQVWATLAGFT